MAWRAGWGKRIRLTIDYADIDAILADFPILIYLSASSGRNSADVSAIFDELQSDANRKKIAVTTSDGVTQCYVEIEKWDDANEQAWLWVKVPSVASDTPTELYLYYDVDHADNDDYVGLPGSAPAESVWDANFKLVTHLRDDPDTANVRDSTDNNNDGAKKGAAEPAATASGKIDDAQDFDGIDDFINFGTDSSLTSTKGTFELWISGLTSGAYEDPLHFYEVTSWDYILLRKSDTDTLQVQIEDGNVGKVGVTTTETITDTDWHYIAFTQDGSGVKIYLDGQICSIGGLNSAYWTDHLALVVSWIGKSHWRVTACIIDEFRLSDTARTAAWFKATYESEIDDLLAFGSEEIVADRVFIDAAGVQVEKGSILVDLRIEERSTAEFTIVDLPGTASYSKGQPVLIYDPDNTLIFGGVIDTPDTIRTAPSGELLHPIRCADYHYFADKRLVAESYLDKTCGFIVDDLFDKYLAAEGITIGSIELGATLIEAIFNYVRVTDAYDALAEKAGKVWFIDEHKALYFQNRDTTAAPWTATGDDMAKGSSRLSGGNPQYRNRQYIRGGRGTTLLQTEKFVADGQQNAFTLSFPCAKVPTFVEVNSVNKTPLGIKGLDAPGDFASYWNKGDPTITLKDVPTATWIVEIRYYGQFDILTLAEDTDEIAARLAIEGAGTGYVDDIADEPTLNDKDASFDSALAKLARFGVIGKHLFFQTTRSGLKPGQLLPVNYPALNLDSEEMLIEAVRIRVITGHVTYGITAIQGPVMGSWTGLFKALAAMKSEVVERLNVGSEQILIILATRAETWEIEEDIDVTVLTCDVVGTARVDTAIVC